MCCLCRGEPAELSSWLADERAGKAWVCLGFALFGAGIYGASIGLWRAPLQAAYVGIKVPLLIALTTVINCLLNGMLAQLLGARLSFRQSALAVVMSFSILSIVLGIIDRALPDEKQFFLQTWGQAANFASRSSSRQIERKREGQ